MKTKEQAPKSVLQPSATDASFDRTAGSSYAPPPLQLHVDDSSTSSLGTVQRESIPEEEELQMKADESIQRTEEEEELQMKADESIQRTEEEEELMA